jgi:ribokinase
MRILNIGSLNFDFAYNVPHIVRQGETIPAEKREILVGGKGLNQAIALARAGADVFMAGAVGTDGAPLLEALQAAGVNPSFVKQLDGPSGHALIQITPDGANSIIVYGGTNDQITTGMIDEVLCHFHEGDIILLQNEVSNVAYAMTRARAKGLRVVFNPSPVTGLLLQYPLNVVDIFILNEVEGQIISQMDGSTDYPAILERLYKIFPNSKIVLTIGKGGVLYRDAEQFLTHGIYNVQAVDTTAAGDTFCGYFLACIAKGMDAAKALEYASKASSLAVGKKGAAVSIPAMTEVELAPLLLQQTIGVR